MKIQRSVYALVALMFLAACSGSHRPVYSGHEESTEGVPGFVNGKKTSPHVKLGQSYTVDGETYVPRNQPDYVEEGMASWYGPGFHGGKTANGERFDSDELTAAHRTLPLPSIVRVTMLATGKQVIVRVNDRGPFAHSRIIDLSRAAAQKIGLLGAGVAKVRVEYMQEESKRFAELLGEGKDPKSIDLASEILNYTPSRPSSNSARGDVRVASLSAKEEGAPEQDSSFWDSPEAEVMPQTSEPNQTESSAPVSQVTSNDLAPSSSKEKNNNLRVEASPFEALEPAASKAEISDAGNSSPVSGGQFYVQLGAFQSVENAAKTREKYLDIGESVILKKINEAGKTLHHVRMGPYRNAEEGNSALNKLRAVGADPRIIFE